jgi:D-xylose transport system substrate-binding protein
MRIIFMCALKKNIYLLFFLVVIIGIPSAACSRVPTGGTNSARGTKKIKIGLSMDTLKEERWQKDRDLFVRRAEELGAEVIVQSADGNDETQVKQAESLLTQGVDVLVIIPHNAEVAGTIVDTAKRQNVPVISYDRLIRNSVPDLYISFDNEKVGELQAKYLLDRAPKGNYILIGGAPTDNNAKLLRQGQLNILQPSIDKGDIKIVADQWAKDWLADEALKHTENALTQNNNDVVAVVASNDSTAGGVVEALKPQGLAGKVLVSGQDADLAALQRVAADTQSMTVYKPISQIAPRAAEAAVALAKKEKLETTKTVNNGKADIPSILLEPVTVDKSNIDDTVIKDGYQKREDVYKKN